MKRFYVTNAAGLVIPVMANCPISAMRKVPCARSVSVASQAS